MNEWEWQLLEEGTLHESVCVDGIALRKGDVVRLRPKGAGDIFDLALAGQLAVIEAIEQDYEGNLHLAVVLEEDPGRDLGMLRQPGHRFFFSPAEVEPVAREDAARNESRASNAVGPGPRILVAGIGNIFHGDDGFGVEVAQRLAGRKLPECVTVKDFGIRSHDLAYALLDDHHFVILVDASPRGNTPGTLQVLELDGAVRLAPEGEQVTLPDAHTMTPASVFALAQGIGDVTARVLLVACEPATLGGEDGRMGLSDAVAASVDRAANLVEQIVSKLHSGIQPEELF